MATNNTTNKNSKISLIILPILMGLFAFPALAYVPSVQTDSLLAVSGSCAMLQGNSSSNISQTRWFEIKELDKNMTPTQVRPLNDSSWYSSGNVTNGVYKGEATRLTPDTDYVFRAVAQNKDGITYGNERSFRTKSVQFQTGSSANCSSYVPMTTNEQVSVSGSNGGASPYSYTSSSNGTQTTYTSGSQTTYTNGNTIPLNQGLVTLNASDITDISARLNSRTYPTQNIPQYGYYEWGKTSSFGNTTQSVALGSGANLMLIQTITNLAPGTTYYFRPVITNQLGTVQGSTYRFTTAGVSSSVSTTVQTTYSFENASYNSTPVSGNTIKTSTNETPSSLTKAPVQSLKTNKTITITDESEVTSVAPGEIMRQTFVFENTTGGVLTGVEIKSVLPVNSTFVAKNSDPFTEQGQLITLPLSEMNPGQRTSVVYWIKVSGDAKDKTSLETTVISTATDSRGAQVKNFLEVSISVDASLVSNNNGNVAAAVLSGNYSIFPKTLGDWYMIITLLALAVIGYFAWKYYNRLNEDLSSSGIPSILEVQVADIPKQPIVSKRVFVKDPFYNIHKQEEKTLEVDNYTSKSAPPENLPV